MFSAALGVKLFAAPPLIGLASFRRQALGAEHRRA